MPGSSGVDSFVGWELAGYRIEEIVGRGGMGVVYKAHDPALDRRVALKVIAPELAEDARFRSRFLRESRVSASLDHSHIVPIFDAGEADGQLYIAMRYVDGSDLAVLLEQEGALEPERALAILAQAASALDAAHNRGLVHRDVKPANVLLTSEEGRADHVYLSDFGLTREHGEGPADEPTDVLVLRASASLGTIDYAAPEQIRGHAADERSDTYSLTCVLYECLSGGVPYRASPPMGVLFGHLEEPSPILSRRSTELPAGIDAVIERGMAKEPADRYASATELIDAARSVLVPERPVVSRSGRRGIALVVVALVALLAAAAAIPAILLTGGGESGTDTAPPTTDLDQFEGSVLQRIDPETNELVNTVPVAASSLDPLPRAKRHVATADAVWSINPGDLSVQRISAETNTIDLTKGVSGKPVSIAADDEFVWVASELNEEGTVTKLSTSSGAILNQIDLGPFLPRVAVAGENAVWLAGIGFGEVFGESPGPAGGLLVRIDRETDAATATPLETQPWDIAAGEGAAWVAGNPPGNVRAIVIEQFDPLTGTATDSMEFAAREGGGKDNQLRLATGEGFLWLGGTGVTRIDPRTGDAVTLDREEAGPDLSPSEVAAPFTVAVGHGSLWVSTASGKVLRIDPATLTVVASLTVGPVADTITVGSDAVWVEACEGVGQILCADPVPKL